MKKSNNPLALLSILIIVGVVGAVLIFNLVSHPTSKTEKELEEEASLESIKNGNEEREKYPLLEKLPIKTSLYSIGYVFENEEPTITIDTDETYLNAAINELNSLDSDEKPLSSYNIRITGLPSSTIIKEESQAEDLKQFLEESLKSTDSSFKVGETKELENGYFAAILTTGSEETYNLVKYRLVLKKQGTWNIAAGPELILTTKNTDLEANLLQKANEL